MYCQVIVDIAHENVAKPFTYLIPEGMKLEPGQRVEVPFGTRKSAEGRAIPANGGTPAFRRKRLDPRSTVIRPLEDYPAILPPLILLAEEMAEKAHCPLAETLRLMIPAEMRGGRVRVRTERIAELACGPRDGGKGPGGGDEEPEAAGYSGDAAGGVAPAGLRDRGEGQGSPGRAPTAWRRPG